VPPHERADFEDELDRLRMMRVAEEGLGVGDPLPDFSLEDGSGRQAEAGQGVRTHQAADVGLGELVAAAEVRVD
jgi:hypothetical protein